MNSLLKLCALSCLVFELQAQEGPRELRGAADKYHNQDELGTVQISPKSSIIEWSLWWPTPQGPNPTTATLPFDRPGSLGILPNKEVLACGRNSSDGSGWLSHWRLLGTATTGRVIVSLSTRNYGASLDLLSVVWNQADSRLYAIDLTQPAVALLSAPWTGTGALPDTTSWEVIALGSHASLPYLKVSSLTPLANGVRVTSLLGATDVYAQGSAWVISAVSGSLGPPIGWEVLDSYYLGSNHTWFIRGATGQFDLTELESQATILSASSPNSTAWNSVSVPRIPGLSYQFTGTGSIRPSNTIWPLMRYGWPPEAPSTTWPSGSENSLGIWIARGDLPSAAAMVGNARFRAKSSIVNPDPSVTTPQNASVSLFIGTVIPGIAPVVNANGVVLMANPAIVLGPSTIQFTTVGNIAFSVPIPNDPFLAGGNVIFQFVAILESSDVLVSDVFGTNIFPAGFWSSEDCAGCLSVFSQPPAQLAPTVRKSFISGLRSNHTLFLAQVQAMQRWMTQLRSEKSYPGTTGTAFHTRVLSTLASRKK